jgi:hypothetical protein
MRVLKCLWELITAPFKKKSAQQHCAVLECAISDLLTDIGTINWALKLFDVVDWEWSNAVAIRKECPTSLFRAPMSSCIIIKDVLIDVTEISVDVRVVRNESEGFNTGQWESAGPFWSKTTTRRISPSVN